MPPDILLEKGEESPIGMAGWLLACCPVLPFAFDEIHIVAGKPSACLLVGALLQQQYAISSCGEIKRFDPAKEARLATHLRVLQLLPDLSYPFCVLPRPAQAHARHLTPVLEGFDRHLEVRESAYLLHRRFERPLVQIAPQRELALRDA